MPKRSIEEKIEKLNTKIRKLQDKKKERVHKRLRIISSSSDTSEENNQDGNNEQEVINDVHNDANITTNLTLECPTVEQQISPEPAPAPESEVNQSSDVTPAPEPEPSTSKEVPPTSDEVGLDPELLQALGESTSDVPEYGEPIHDTLAKLWLPVLKKGLSKENKDNLIKQNLIPDNCKLLQSPKLNAEITAAVSELVRGRDKKLNGFQQRLGAGITAVNRGMGVLLSSDKKVQALKHLSDACRILTDLHYSWTQDRIKLITPSLEKNFTSVIQDSERDDTLFGNSLGDKIKASKAITRQGLQIKKTMTNPKPATVASQSTMNRSAPQGNWRGPPRYQSSRGGRGSYKKISQPPRTYTPATAPAKPPTQYKPRAPTQ